METFRFAGTGAEPYDVTTRTGTSFEAGLRPGQLTMAEFRQALVEILGPTTQNEQMRTLFMKVRTGGGRDKSFVWVPHFFLSLSLLRWILRAMGSSIGTSFAPICCFSCRKSTTRRIDGRCRSTTSRESLRVIGARLTFRRKVGCGVLIMFLMFLGSCQSGVLLHES